MRNKWTLLVTSLLCLFALADDRKAPPTVATPSKDAPTAPQLEDTQRIERPQTQQRNPVKPSGTQTTPQNSFITIDSVQYPLFIQVEYYRNGSEAYTIRVHDPQNPERTIANHMFDIDKDNPKQANVGVTDVREDFRGKGINEKLFEEMVKIIRPKGINRIHAELALLNMEEFRRLRQAILSETNGQSFSERQGVNKDDVKRLREISKSNLLWINDNASPLVNKIILYSHHAYRLRAENGFGKIISTKIIPGEMLEFTVGLGDPPPNYAEYRAFASVLKITTAQEALEKEKSRATPDPTEIQKATARLESSIRSVEREILKNPELQKLVAKEFFRLNPQPVEVALVRFASKIRQTENAPMVPISKAAKRAISETTSDPSAAKTAKKSLAIPARRYGKFFLVRLLGDPIGAALKSGEQTSSQAFRTAISQLGPRDIAAYLSFAATTDTVNRSLISTAERQKIAAEGKLKAKPIAVGALAMAFGMQVDRFVRTYWEEKSKTSSHEEAFKKAIAISYAQFSPAMAGFEVLAFLAADGLVKTANAKMLEFTIKGIEKMLLSTEAAKNANLAAKLRKIITALRTANKVCQVGECATAGPFGAAVALAQEIAAWVLSTVIIDRTMEIIESHQNREEYLAQSGKLFEGALTTVSSIRGETPEDRKKALNQAIEKISAAFTELRERRKLYISSQHPKTKNPFTQFQIANAEYQEIRNKFPSFLEKIYWGDIKDSKIKESQNFCVNKAKELKVDTSPACQTRRDEVKRQAFLCANLIAVNELAKKRKEVDQKRYEWLKVWHEVAAKDELKTWHTKNLEDGILAEKLREKPLLRAPFSILASLEGRVPSDRLRLIDFDQMDLTVEDLYNLESEVYGHLLKQTGAKLAEPLTKPIKIEPQSDEQASFIEAIINANDRLAEQRASNENFTKQEFPKSEFIQVALTKTEIAPTPCTLQDDQQPISSYTLSQYEVLESKPAEHYALSETLVDPFPWILLQDEVSQDFSCVLGLVNCGLALIIKTDAIDVSIRSQKESLPKCSENKSFQYPDSFSALAQAVLAYPPPLVPQSNQPSPLRQQPTHHHYGPAPKYH